MLMTACERGEGTEPSPAASSTHTPPDTTTAAASPSSSASPSPSPSPSEQARLELPSDAPTTFDEPRSATELARDDYAGLAPPGAEITVASHQVTPEDPIDQIAFAWRRGADVFASEQGFVVWQRFEGDPAWRAVFAFTDEPSSGVLGIELETGDLTADGVADILTLEQLGGSGACGTWRVISPSLGAADEVFRRQTCDARFRIVGGDLELREAVFEPDDPHCCPSAVRISRFEWDGGAFVKTRSEVVEPSS